MTHDDFLMQRTLLTLALIVFLMLWGQWWAVHATVFTMLVWKRA